MTNLVSRNSILFSFMHIAPLSLRLLMNNHHPTTKWNLPQQIGTQSHYKFFSF